MPQVWGLLMITSHGPMLWKHCKLQTCLGWQIFKHLYPTTPGKMWKNEHKCILNLFNQLLFTNCKRRWFLTIKRPKSFKNCFCYSFVAKKLEMELEEMFGFFLEGCLSFSLRGQLTSSSTFLKLLQWFELTCFFNTFITLVVLYIINPFLAWVFLLHLVLNYYDKKYNA
jgi:hypothetical protein